MRYPPHKNSIPVPAQEIARHGVFVSPPEAARYIGVSDRTIRRWIAQGRLPAKRFGPRTVRIRLADLETLGSAIPTAGGVA